MPTAIGDMFKNNLPPTNIFAILISLLLSLGGICIQRKDVRSM